jgi:hypothetical protein
LSKFCSSQLSSIFYLSQEPLSCRVSFLKETYNFQLFKKAICNGACTLKCTEKRFIPFASLIFPPHRIQGKPCIRPEECTACMIHLLEIIRLSDFSSPLFYPSLLDPTPLHVNWFPNGQKRSVAGASISDNQPSIDVRDYTTVLTQLRPFIKKFFSIGNLTVRSLDR